MIWPVDWDPWGELLTYSGPSGLHLVSADGSSDRVLGSWFSAGWSDSGAELVAARQHEAGFTVHVFDRTGASVLDFAERARWSSLSGVRWAKDDQWMVFWTGHSLYARRRADGEGRTLWSGDQSTQLFGVAVLR